MEDLDFILQNVLAQKPSRRANFLFLQSPNSQELYKELAERLRKTSVYPVRAHLFPGEDHRAFSPFLDWLASDETVRKIDEEELVNRGVYTYHAPLILQALNAGLVQREEELLPGEREFEEATLLESLWKFLWHQWGREPQVFLIVNAHFLPLSSIRWLKKLAEEVAPGPFTFIFTMNMEARPGISETSEDWSALLQRSEEDGSILTIQFGPDPGEPFPVSRLTLPSDLQEAERSFHLLALDDAKILLEGLYVQHADGVIKLSVADQYRLHRLLGLVYFYFRDLDVAMGHFHNLHALALKENNLEIISEALRRTAQVYHEKGNLDQADLQAMQALRAAQQKKSPILTFYAQFVLFQIEDKRRALSPEEFQKNFAEVVKASRRLGFRNLFSYLTTNPFGVYTALTEETQALHKRGLQIARKAKNWFRLAAAYQTRGLAFAVKGEYEKVFDDYQKSRRLKLRLGNHLELAFIHNGLGFYYYLTSEYGKAHKYFSEAIDYLKEGKDYHEIAMTLFNMAVNAMTARTFRLSLDFIKKCLAILKTLDRKQLAYHSELGILVVLGFSALKENKFTQAWQVFLKIQRENLHPFPGKNEEFFLWNLFQALLEELRPTGAGPTYFWEQCEEFLFRGNDRIDYFAPMYFWEKGEYLLRQGIEDLAEVAFKEGMTWAEKFANTFYQSLFSDVLKKRPTKTASPLKEEVLDLTWVLSGAQTQKNLITLHQRVEDIHFLSSLQGLFTEEQNPQALIQKTIDQIFSTMEIQGAFFHNWEKTKPSLAYFRKNLAGAERSGALVPLLVHLKKDPDQKFFPDLPPSDLPEQYHNSSALSFFFPIGEKRQGHILILFDKNSPRIKSEKIQVLGIACRQLGTTLEMLEQRELIISQNSELKEKNVLLEKTSSTDHQTGLGNRKALFQNLKMEAARIQRYSAAEKEPLSVLLLDLDNFKFINDSYGHAAGDFILQQVAKAFQACMRETDQLFRIGGDEFVIMAPLTTITGAEELGQRILKALGQEDSFQTALSSFLGKPAQVPSDKKLSVSIGIAQADFSTDTWDPDILLNQADKALFRARGLGRSQISVF